MRSLLRPWNLPSPALIARVARRPLAFRPEVAAMTLLPRGQVDISERARGLDEFIGDRWPEGLRICAVRRTDGARVVFGRAGAPPARLAAAVLASCAIPGYFRPVTIEGTEYVDGGVHSATNADVLKSEGLDVVVVVSSMSAAHGRGERCRRLAAAHRAPPHGARDRPPGGGRHRGDHAWSPAPSHARPWGCGPWPRTGAPGRRGRLRGDPERILASPVLASLGGPGAGRDRRLTPGGPGTTR